MAEDQITENVEYLEQATNVLSVVSSATPSVNTELYGGLYITALAADISVVTVSEAAPKLFQKLVVRIKDNGAGTHTGAYSIAWGAQFEAAGVALPVATVASKRITVTFLYDTVTSKWGSVAVVTEA